MPTRTLFITQGRMRSLYILTIIVTIVYAFNDIYDEWEESASTLGNQDPNDPIMFSKWSRFVLVNIGEDFKSCQEAGFLPAAIKDSTLNEAANVLAEFGIKSARLHKYIGCVHACKNLAIASDDLGDRIEAWTAPKAYQQLIKYIICRKY